LKQILIIGMGLMGGSLAGALKKNNVGYVVGADINAQAVDTALSRGFIHQGCSSYREIVPAADVIILATPVGDIINLIPEVGKLAKAGAVITDLGSTKEEIVRRLDALPEQIHAVGGHPMCGKFEAGVEYSDPDLYVGKTFVLTPGVRTAQATLELLEELIQRIGGVSKQLDAGQHDQLVALTSHLPRMLPLALLSLIHKKDNEAIWSLAGGNLQSSTSLATNNISMWLDIISTNSHNLAATLRGLSQELEILARQIEEQNQNAIHERLQDAAESWSSHFAL
jgi:prephenate dehydrogenase